MTRELYCINCPIGCKLTIQKRKEDIIVGGQGCNKGYEFAQTEATNPTRSLTTTVRTTVPGVPVLPVRTDGEIPKGKIAEAMRAINSMIIVRRGLDCGDVVMENVAGTGINIIATSDLLRQDAKQADEDDEDDEDEQAEKIKPTKGKEQPKIVIHKSQLEKTDGDLDEDEEEDIEGEGEEEEAEEQEPEEPSFRAGRARIR
jgi:CxxC motif-containing protein